MTVLPADLRAVVEAFIADLDLDLTSAAATSGRCESVSRKLAAHLRDEGFVAFEASAWGVNDVPAAVDAVTDSESGEWLAPCDRDAVIICSLSVSTSPITCRGGLSGMFPTRKTAGDVFTAIVMAFCQWAGRGVSSASGPGVALRFKLGWTARAERFRSPASGID